MTRLLNTRLGSNYKFGNRPQLAKPPYFHHQPLRHWLNRGVLFSWYEPPSESSQVFVECFEMLTEAHMDKIEFPVHPMGNLKISINFMRHGIGVYLFGLNDTTWPGVLDGGDTVFGGAFKLGYVQNILGIPASELTGKIIDMAEIWPKRTAMLIDCITCCSSLEQRASVMESFFRYNLRQNPVGNPLVESALEMLKSSSFRSIDNIAQKHNVSRRHLSRLFSQHVGLAPKTIGKFYRLKKIKAALKHYQDIDLDHLTYSLGYYDQAHFIKEFKAYFGASPLKYVKNGLDLS